MANYRKSFKVWLEQEHPEFFEEGWGKGLTAAVLAGATLAGPAAKYTMNPYSVDAKASASYANFMDPVAQKNYQIDLERAKQGLPPLNHGDGEETNVAAQDKIVNDETPGSDNFLARQGKKAGAELIYPDGFGREKSDFVRATDWRTPFNDTQADVEKRLRANALKQMQLKHQKNFNNIDFSKMNNADVRDFKLQQ